MHKILYENNLFKFELIAQCEPTKNGINEVTQIENGQFIVYTRDQHLFLFSKYIINKNFQKLQEITKNWPMEALQPFEIKKNIIGVYWHFDDAENDSLMSDNETWENNHVNDGLYIYEIKNDEMEKLKIIKKEPNNYHSFIYLKNSIIIEYYINFERKISILNKNNLQVINNLAFTDDNSLS